MKNKIILLLIPFLINLGNTYGQKKFKELFEEAKTFLDNDDYNSALPVLLEMDKDNKKNFNTKATIGYCYLMTNYDKAKAIPYFEEVLADYKNLTIKFRPGNPKEKKAPIEVLRWIGEAYHYSYQFDNAMSKYNEYKSILDVNNAKDIEIINRDIFITENAIKYKGRKVDMSIEGIANINTTYPEYRPKITGDENVMFFTSRRPNDERNATEGDGKYFEDIYYSEKKFGVWSKPKLVEKKLNTNAHDACLYIAPDGQYMLIFRASSTTLQTGGIYETKLEGDTWSSPKLLKAMVNSDYWETDVNISANGKTMYFTSDRPGGIGGRDIWVMKKLPNGNWADVTNIGDVINTKYNEQAPYMHPDGKTLFFSSQGHATMGGYDVFKTDLQDDGTWSTPENIGFPINTTGDDVFYFPTNDGHRAYFSSYREGGKGDQDIYILKLPSNPEKTLAIYKGIAKDDNGNVLEDLVITIFNEDGEEDGIYRPNTKSGRFLFILKPGQTYNIEYENNGVIAQEDVEVGAEGGVQNIARVVSQEGDKMFIRTATVDDNDIISLVTNDNPDNLDITNIDIAVITNDADNDNSDANSDSNDEQNTDTTDDNNDSTDGDQTVDNNTNDNSDGNDTSNDNNNTADNGNNVTEYTNQGEMLKDLYFKYDRVILIDKSEIDYENTLNFLTENPDAKVMIEGHTDSHGSAEYNLWLSSARSNKIRNRLYDEGVAWGRMKTRGYGEGKPIYPNKNADGTDNPEGRQLNRRVSFILDEKTMAVEANSFKMNSIMNTEEKPSVDYTNQYEDATVSFSEEVVCMIQLGAFSDKLDNTKFTEEPLEVAFYKDEDGLYKYLSGAFINKETALEHRLRMIDEGYNGSFLVYFQDGKRLTQEEVALLYPTEDGFDIENTTVSTK